MRFLLILALMADFAAGQTKDCTAEGTVVNAITGDPVAHAQVVATQDRGASTDAAGKWSIAGLPCGAMHFTVNRAGFLETDGAPGPIRMTPQAAVSGKVLDDSGDPIAGAEIRIFSSVVQRGRRVMGGSVSVSSNPAGEYHSGPLAAGRYIVCARSGKVTYPVGGGGRIAYAESCYPVSPSAGAGNALRLAAGQEVHEDFRIPALPGVHVRGTVTGVPAGARIVVEIADGLVAKQASQAVQGGKFDFAGVLPGSYVFSGLAVVDGGSRLANAEVRVGSSDVEGVALTFAPNVTVTAMVRSAGGKLPDEFRLNVSLIPLDPGSYVGIPERDASENSLEWSNIAPGRYRIDTTLPPAPYYIKSVSLEGRDLRGEEFTITGSTGPLQIAIGDDGGKLEGSVAGADGKPASAQIMLLRGNLAPLQARSGESGRFTLAGVPPGDYLAYAFDDTRNVEYAEPEWMRLNAGAGVPVSIAPGSSSTVSLVRITVLK